MGNALKFQRPGVPPVVTVSAIEQGDAEQAEVVLSFADNGIGFEEQYLDRIFEVFQRLHGRNEYEGTGIGLAICRKIVERHGGTITAQSKPGEGSTFLVTLPKAQNSKEESRG
jgi:signal transduction histidine kinase